MHQHYLEKTSKLIFLILYLSMYVSLYLGEDTLGAAKSDYVNHKLNASYFINNIFQSLLIYDTYDAAHSPIFLIIQSLFLKYFDNDIYFKILNLNINIFIIFIFYNALKLLFGSNIKNYLLIFSCVIFISPTFRSSSIWPDSFLCGLLFFVCSIYFFIKFKKKNKGKFKNSILNTFFLAISSYISPNFAILVIVYFFEFFRFFKFSKELLCLIIFNFVLAFPALYYVFVLDIFFFSTRGRYNDDLKILSLRNLSNKIIIFPTIVFFHFLFLLFTTLKNKENKKKIKIILELTIIISIISIASYYFDYKNIYTNLGGGGIFYKISNILFNNNLLLFLFSLLSLIFVNKYIIQSKLKNFFILLLILASFPQGRIYHQYFELILFFSIFCLMDLKITSNFFIIKKNLLYTYFSFFIFWFLSLIKISLNKGFFKIFN